MSDNFAVIGGLLGAALVTGHHWIGWLAVVYCAGLGLVRVLEKMNE